MSLKDFNDGKIEERNDIIRRLKKEIQKYEKMNSNDMNIIFAYANRETALDEFMESLKPKLKDRNESLGRFV